jgi:outer membrane protein assembly factor BamB
MSDFTPHAPGVPRPLEPDVPLPAANDLALPAAGRRLRLWPGVVFIVLQAAIIFVPQWVAPGTMAQFYLSLLGGPVIGAVTVVAWWLFASRLRWTDRLLVPLVAAAAAGLALRWCDPSFRFGMLMYALPLVTTAWVLWLVVTPFLSWPVRRLGLLVLLVAAWGCSTLIRMDGVTGSFSPELSWRWSATPEDHFLAEHGAAPTTDAVADEVVSLQPGDWLGFRGPQRDGRLSGVRIATDWAARPPRQVWRHRVGPGWGSFAVVGHRAYTQEQRGEDEAVVCYDANTGEELWVHADKVRFTETVSGAGPRATPTFDDGKLYALGARGRLNCLDPATGRVLWSRDAAEDTKDKEDSQDKKDTETTVPIWGFASSPLVRGGLVTVFTGGANAKAIMIAYDTATGEPAWKAEGGKHSYCSPQPARLGGVEQILIASDAGVTALHPTRGDVLWRHSWPSEPEGFARCVQPAVTEDGDVLIGTGPVQGERRVHVTHEGDSWAADEARWSSKALKAYFNDRVVHKGHIYGIDGDFLTCLSLEDGKARWRGGRYGHGQVLLLADQDLLLILSEKGEVVLVAADPEKHRELARFPAIEGKTWNHPVVAHGKLFVRNGEEAACYELP